MFDAWDIQSSLGLKGELDSIAATRAPNCTSRALPIYTVDFGLDRWYAAGLDCGSCYGGQPGESGCCNTCEEVRESYVRRGWSFSDPDGIEQVSLFIYLFFDWIASAILISIWQSVLISKCVQEHWSDKIKEQSKEGCNVHGHVKVNKVSVFCATLLVTFAFFIHSSHRSVSCATYWP